MNQYYSAPELPRALIDSGYAKPGEAPNYTLCYMRILSGEIEAERVNGRYRIKRSQLAKIAKLFGLTAPSVAA